jgi:3-methyl-2-oxobutanoate hydroxymethyltransferase
VARLTLKDLRAAKGARRLVQVYVRTPREAAACEEAGVDMIVVAEADTGTPNDLHGIREAAAGTFLTVGLEPYTHAGTVEVLRAAYRLVRLGVDAVYCSYGYDTVKTLADEYVPVVGHVGLVPYRSSWFGGMRAVGTTAEDALEVWRRTMRYKEAGAVAVEMELVPTPVATEIARRTSMLVIGMGSGPAATCSTCSPPTCSATTRGTCCGPPRPTAISAPRAGGTTRRSRPLRSSWLTCAAAHTPRPATR